jgi:hypothetical protein
VLFAVAKRFVARKSIRRSTSVGFVTAPIIRWSWWQGARVPASRLNDVLLTLNRRRDQVALARRLVLMLCAGALQGDLSGYLSGYNVLAGRRNIGARSMLVLDMNNISVCLGRPLPRFWVPTTAAKSGRSTGQGSCIRKSTGLAPSSILLNVQTSAMSCGPIKEAAWQRYKQGARR